MSEFPRRLGVVRSMPQITIDGELLGGINQLLKLARAGGLERIANDDSQPWVTVKRRLGRGYSVILLDALGRDRSAALHGRRRGQRALVHRCVLYGLREASGKQSGPAHTRRQAHQSHPCRA